MIATFFYDGKMYDATTFKNEFDVELPQWLWDGLPNRQIKIKKTNEGTIILPEIENKKG